MTQHPTTNERGLLSRRNLFFAAAALQVGCGLIFATDVLSEVNHFTSDTWIELTGVVALAIGATITIGQSRQLLQRNTKVERELSAASGAFQDVIDHHFAAWHLTDAEKDVALLSIKGVSITDIANMRQTRSGTIKAQSTAIYRKAGVSNRAELISVMIEDLISGLGMKPD